MRSCIFAVLPVASVIVAAGAFCGGCASGGGAATPDARPTPRDAGPSSDAGSDAGPDAGARTCAVDVDCDDGDACNGTERCAGGICATGAPVDCDDAVGCTDDRCDPASGACSHTPDDTRCAAGLVCDPVDDCAAPPPCENDADCDDGRFCNGVETCDRAFGCRRGDPPSCDDGHACTVDTCDAASDACVSTPDATRCDDGRICNGTETCDPRNPAARADGCVTGTPPVCDDGVACTVDRCEESAGGCTSTPDDGRCSDGVFCNGAEVCDPRGGCRPGTPPSCEDSIGCTVGRCDPARDACLQVPDDASCQDGLACNGAERCDASGVTPGRGCVSGAPMDCSDGLACTTDACVEPGTCTHTGTDADRDGFVAVGCGTGNDCDDRSPSIYPGATELCDGVDNDCSGAADDGSGMECPFGSPPRSCTTSCGTPGTQVCTAACRLGACVASSETCNGCDDDGDGIADDGFACRRGQTQSCTTACGTPGTQSCNASCSGYSTCLAASETCGNGCDDNGNGTVDEGCVTSPPNDRCTGAIALSMSGYGTTVSGSTTGASNESGCGSGGDVYYSFTLTRREVVYVHTHLAASYDTMVGIATGCSGTIACIDDSCSSVRSEVVQVLGPGTYYVVVSGFGGQTGTFTLRFEHLPTGNGTPTVLSRPASGTVISGTTSGTGTEVSCTGSGPENMYYFTTCPGYAGGSFSASTCSRASWDTVLYFRDAASGAADVCNDDACGLQSQISGTVSGGAGLRALYIDGFGASAGGAYSIQVTMP